MFKKKLPDFVISFVVFISSTVLFSQTPQPNPVGNPAVDKGDHSESVPYEPRTVTAKDSKEKKKPKNEDPSSIPAKAVAESDNLLVIPVMVFNSTDLTVGGLSKSDFRVFIGDEEQTIVSVDAGDKPRNVVLMLDVSPSTDSRFKEIQAMATQIAEELRPEDKVMVVQFSANMKVLCDFTTDRTVISRAIKRSEMADGTSLYSSLEELERKKLTILDGPSTVILFSDGMDTTSGKTDYPRSLVEMEKAKVTVVPIFFDTASEQMNSKRTSPANIMGAIAPYALGPTKEEREKGISYLNDLVNLSGGRPIVYSPQSDSKSISKTVAVWLGGQYYVSVKVPLSAQANKRLPVKVRVNRPNLKVLAKGSYFGK